MLLILDVLGDHLSIQANRIHAVSWGPRMIAPIGAFAQLLVTVQYADRRAAFDHTAIIRYRYLRRYHYQKVDMIQLDTHFQNLYLLLFGKCPNAIANLMANATRQYPIAIFRNPNNMVLAVSNAM